MQLVVSAGTARQTPRQNGLAALTAETVLFTKIDGSRARPTASPPPADRSTTPSIPDVVRFALEVLPSALPAVTRRPRARDRRARHVDRRRSPRRARRSTRASTTTRAQPGHGRASRCCAVRTIAAAPARRAYGTRASLAELGPADVTAFFAAHYLRDDAFATATGRVDDAANAAVNAVIAAFPPGSEAPLVLSAQAFGAAAQAPGDAARDRRAVRAGRFRRARDERSAISARCSCCARCSTISPSRQSTTTLAPFQRGINVVYAYDVKPATFTVDDQRRAELDPNARSDRAGGDREDRVDEAARGRRAQALQTSGARPVGARGADADRPGVADRRRRERRAPTRRPRRASAPRSIGSPLPTCRRWRSATCSTTRSRWSSRAAAPKYLRRCASHWSTITSISAAARSASSRIF